jgi:hypothetical protein
VNVNKPFVVMVTSPSIIALSVGDWVWNTSPYVFQRDITADAGCPKLFFPTDTIETSTDGLDKHSDG